jgi:hypothetical protein
METGGAATAAGGNAYGNGVLITSIRPEPSTDNTPLRPAATVAPGVAGTLLWKTHASRLSSRLELCASAPDIYSGSIASRLERAHLAGRARRCDDATAEESQLATRISATQRLSSFPCAVPFRKEISTPRAPASILGARGRGRSTCVFLSCGGHGVDASQRVLLPGPLMTHLGMVGIP